jgi:hypothetical protein
MRVHGVGGRPASLRPRRALGWLALACLLVGAGGPARAATGPAALSSATSAPVAPAQAPAAPVASPTACQTATLPQLTDLLDKLPRESVVPATELMPDGAESIVTYLHPNAAGGHVGFVAFLAPITPKNQFDPNDAVALTVLRIDHPPGDAQTSSLSAADSQNAYQLHLQAPQLSSWNLREQKMLVVFACGDVGGVAQPIGYAARPVEMSTQEAATIAGLLVVLGFYLLGATVVWAQRKSDAKSANRLHATPPTRVTQIVAWPWLRCLDPVWMSSDMFDRASLSKLQILFFALVVAFGVTYSVVRTGALSDLSPSIVLLLGIPALGALGNQAAATTRDRISLDNWAWLANRGVFPVNDPGRDTPRWRDLVMSDAELDLYKLQALMFSVIVGVALVTAGFSNLATFKVPDTLMQILGLSQVVFVGGRLTKPSTLGDLDDLVTELRARAAALKAAVSSGIDVDSSGKPLQPAAAGRRPGQARTLDEARARAPNAVSRYEDTESEVQLLLEQMTHRDVATGGLTNPLKP